MVVKNAYIKNIIFVQCVTVFIYALFQDRTSLVYQNDTLSFQAI